jgi:hypothetical protein
MLLTAENLAGKEKIINGEGRTVEGIHIIKIDKYHFSAMGIDNQ